MFRFIALQVAFLLSLFSPKNNLENKVEDAIQNQPEKLVALTFDADMTHGMLKKLKSGEVSSWYNKDVIDVLEKTDTPATIFATGLWVETYPEITRELSKNKLFEIENHSYSHPGFTPDCYNLPKVGNKEIEISKTQEIIKNITGSYPKLFRFPGGCFGKEDLDLLKKFNLKNTGWDVVSGDAFNNNPKMIIVRVERKVRPGSIIVMHLNGGKNAPATALALPEIISFLKSSGYKFVKASQLVLD